MKKFFLLILAAVAVLATPARAVEKEVRRALSVNEPFALTLTEADVRATIAHMQALSQSQVQELTVAKAALATEHTAHVAADANVVAAQTAAKKDHADLVDKLWKTRIFGFPITLGIGIFTGIALAVLTRVGVAAGGLAVRAGLKATTGV